MSLLSIVDLERLLAEDVPYGDLTTDAIGIGDREGHIRFSARAAMTVVAIEEAAAMFALADVEIQLERRSGDAVEPGAVLLTGKGCASGLLRVWKVAQTLVEVWSGVATATRSVVSTARAARSDIAVACTRKNVPGTKALAIAAIKAGGAVPHRLGLSETILVFPEHRAFLDDAERLTLVNKLKAHSPEKKLVSEVKSVEEGRAAAIAGFDVIQAEKIAPEGIAQLVSAIATIAPRPLIAAAGGISPDNAAAYVQAGADILVTSWPYTARPADVSVSIEAIERRSQTPR